MRPLLDTDIGLSWGREEVGWGGVKEGEGERWGVGGWGRFTPIFLFMFLLLSLHWQSIALAGNNTAKITRGSHGDSARGAFTTAFAIHWTRVLSVMHCTFLFPHPPQAVTACHWHSTGTSQALRTGDKLHRTLFTCSRELRRCATSSRLTTAW